MKNQDMETQRVGILGGGQLACMLISAGRQLGLQPLALCGSADDPAAQLAPGCIYGEVSDPTALRRIFAQTDLIIFENEFVNCDAIERVLAESISPPALQPSIAVIRELQDKLRQKEVLQRLRIPTARFQKYEGSEKIQDWVARMLRDFPTGAVFKWAKLGYDGLGTCIIDGAAPESITRATQFAERALKKGVPLYVEEKIGFRRELAMVACRSSSGEFGAYPLVITEQENGVCKRVQGPATALGVSEALETEARRYAEDLAKALSIVGTFAVELFETDAGSLCVNELAPRVHNSGHFSLDASPTSQFENHWRAALGLPLGAFTRPGHEGCFAMVNFLGPARLIGSTVSRAPTQGLSPELHLHWYGKKDVRAGRKMGHVNGLAANAAELGAVLERMSESDSRWQSSLEESR